MSSELSAVWTGIVTDTTPLTSDPAQAARTYAERVGVAGDLCGSLVVNDEQVASLRTLEVPVPFTLRVSGGAGAISGACRLARTVSSAELQSVEIALRDLDDLPGNARRVTVAVDQAYDEGLLSPDVPVYIEVPQVDQREPSHGWLAAADEIAAVEHRLRFRVGGTDSPRPPTSATVAAWVDAALDRELPFRCLGLDRAIRPAEGTGHGTLNLLLATRAAFDGAARDEVVALVEESESEPLIALAGDGELSRARRWLTSVGTTNIVGIADDLTDLGLGGLS